MVCAQTRFCLKTQTDHLISNRRPGPAIMIEKRKEKKSSGRTTPFQALHLQSVSPSSLCSIVFF